MGIIVLNGVSYYNGLKLRIEGHQDEEVTVPAAVQPTILKTSEGYECTNFENEIIEYQTTCNGFEEFEKQLAKQEIAPTSLSESLEEIDKFLDTNIPHFNEGELTVKIVLALCDRVIQVTKYRSLENNADMRYGDAVYFQTDIDDFPPAFKRQALIWTCKMHHSLNRCGGTSDTVPSNQLTQLMTYVCCTLSPYGGLSTLLKTKAEEKVIDLAVSITLAARLLLISLRVDIAGTCWGAIFQYQAVYSRYNIAGHLGLELEDILKIVGGKSLIVIPRFVVEGQLIPQLDKFKEKNSHIVFVEGAQRERFRRGPSEGLCFVISDGHVFPVDFNIEIEINEDQRQQGFTLLNDGTESVGSLCGEDTKALKRQKLIGNKKIQKQLT
ncbi:hypothetical protein MP228_000605 [Amoeboaphelidium protococcarum]|nr:hypothetical protein MP228_000605 [Amoeboaphelidium protococcarum]